MLQIQNITAARPAGTRTPGVTRKEYDNARRLLSDNGRYALRFLPERVRLAMVALLDAPADQLREKAEFLARPDAATWQGCAWNKEPKPCEEFGAYCSRARRAFFLYACRESLARIGRSI